MPNEMPTNPRFKNLTGRNFDRLHVESFSHSHRGQAYWLCLCKCGKRKIVGTAALKKMGTRSCGCLKQESLESRYRTHGYASKKRLRPPEYTCWKRIRARCSNPENLDFPYYGGRGITVCERWLGSDGFANFLKDLGSRPSARHTIDRIDNDGPYSPENCHWATRRQQTRNRRMTVYLTLNGETLTLAEWAERLGIKPDMLYYRRKRGLSDEQILDVATRKKAT